MFAYVNGKKIFFDVVGEGLDGSTAELKERPVFIAIHCASGFDHGYLRTGLDPLATMGQVVYVDLPASGRSASNIATTVTFENLADDIAGLIDYLGLNKPYIIGHCAGGFVAQHFALRHQHKMKGLILVNTSPSFEKIIEDDKPNPSLMDRAPKDVVETCLTVYGKGIITDETVDKCFNDVGPYFLAQDQMENFKAVFSYTSIALPMMDRFVNYIYKTYDVRDKLEQIDAPTLVIAGTQDWLTPASGARFIASKIKNSAYVEFENSCHISFAENRVGFLRSVHNFVGKTESENS